LTKPSEYIYLNLTLRKGGETDADGNYIFETEASNESLDLQGQIVLQSALMESKEHFLKNGVISLEQLHKRKGIDGNTISDPAMIIGETIEVRTEGKKTIVKGKLYHTKKAAQELIKLLQAGSTRVKASVGGLWPRVIKDKNGVEKVTSVLWNDLALTTNPVNSSVSSAYFAKSYEPQEFVKALSAGTGTDSATFANGRALIPEDIGHKKTIMSLLNAISSDEVKDEQEAITYLTNRGFTSEQARSAVGEIIMQGANK